MSNRGDILPLFHVRAIMDDFKRQTMEIVTAYDLLNCPVHYRPSERRKLLKMVRRRARRKLKQELSLYKFR
jgi:hypothetical protein